MTKYIPNLLTLLNVLCGCVATVFAVMNRLEITAFFVVLGIFFDYADGFAARLLGVQSPLGLQLDSLADMITSGLVPGLVMFQLMNMAQSGGWVLEGDLSGMNGGLFPFCGFLITLSSAYRLAKFNLDEEQGYSFRGLPTPANALLILSLPLILIYHGNDVLSALILNPWFLLGMTFLSAYLLNSSVELFALKFKTWDFRDNALRYIFVIISLVLILTMRFLAIPVIIAFYILSSIVTTFSTKKMA